VNVEFSFATGAAAALIALFRLPFIAPKAAPHPPSPRVADGGIYRRCRRVAQVAAHAPSPPPFSDTERALRRIIQIIQSTRGLASSAPRWRTGPNRSDRLARTRVLLSATSGACACVFGAYRYSLARVRAYWCGKAAPT
jgi:hypothetical protein